MDIIRILKILSIRIVLYSLKRELFDLSRVIFIFFHEQKKPFINNFHNHKILCLCRKEYNFEYFQ